MALDNGAAYSAQFSNSTTFDPYAYSDPGQRYQAWIAAGRPARGSNSQYGTFDLSNTGEDTMTGFRGTGIQDPFSFALGAPAGYSAPAAPTAPATAQTGGAPAPAPTQAPGTMGRGGSLPPVAPTGPAAQGRAPTSSYPPPYQGGYQGGYNPYGGQYGGSYPPPYQNGYPGYQQNPWTNPWMMSPQQPPTQQQRPNYTPGSYGSFGIANQMNSRPTTSWGGFQSPFTFGGN